MIDPKSLRIGNTVNCLHHNNDSPDPVKFNVPVTVAEIHSDHLILSTGQRVEIKYFSSIPLSEQELIRLGFENGGYDLLFWSKSHGVQLVEISGFEGSFGIRVNDQVDVTLEYVHDLQNWWQMLTKTELTYKVENETIKS